MLVGHAGCHDDHVLLTLLEREAPPVIRVEVPHVNAEVVLQQQLVIADVCPVVDAGQRKGQAEVGALDFGVLDLVHVLHRVLPVYHLQLRCPRHQLLAVLDLRQVLVGALKCLVPGCLFDEGHFVVLIRLTFVFF